MVQAASFSTTEPTTATTAHALQSHPRTTNHIAEESRVRGYRGVNAKPVPIHSHGHRHAVLSEGMVSLLKMYTHTLIHSITQSCARAHTHTFTHCYIHTDATTNTDARTHTETHTKHTDAHTVCPQCLRSIVAREAWQCSAVAHCEP